MRKQLALQMLAVVAAAGLAKADVAFSDLAATPPYYSATSAYVIYGGNPASYASSFVSLTTGNISTVSVGISLVQFGFDGHVNLSLGLVAPDSPGFTSIALGTTVNAVNTLQDGSQLGTLSLSTLTSPLLVAGQTYYLIVSAASTNTYDYWWGNNPNYNSNNYSSQGAAPFTLIAFGAAPDFEVDTVAAVPEPATWMLPCLGVGAVLWCRRRTRRCVAE